MGNPAGWSDGKLLKSRDIGQEGHQSVSRGRADGGRKLLEGEAGELFHEDWEGH